MNLTLPEFLLKSNIDIVPSALLSDYTTFRLGGQCQALLKCQTPEELTTVVKLLINHHKKFILIGGGSNLVVSDQGVDCYVIRYLSDSPIVERNKTTLTVSGSTVLDDLVIYAAEHGLQGINYCSGIPGTVGGAVVGNAGAFGKQVGDIVKSVTLIDKTGQIKTVTSDKLGFAYRHSHLKETSDIVISVQLNMSSGSTDELQKERHDILAIRKEKHPDLKQYPCAGSFFRNIEPTSKAGKRQAAGWFLEEAGGKTLQEGGAKIFSKHANIIIKSENCTAEDVLNLSQKMQDVVKNKFDLELVREVRFVGPFKNKPTDEYNTVIW